MAHTIEVEIDGNGVARPIHPSATLPKGRALLIWQSGPDIDCALMSEAALAVDWLRPGEDEAWAYLQRDK